MTNALLVVAISAIPLVSGAVLCLVAPRYAWEVNRFCRSWQFANGEVSDPSGAWLVAARISGGLVLVTSAVVTLWILLR